MRRRLPSTSIVVLLLLSTAPARADSGSNRVQVEPESIRIGIAYSGQRVRAQASTPASRPLVMRVTGPEGPLALKRIAKTISGVHEVWVEAHLGFDDVGTFSSDTSP